MIFLQLQQSLWTGIFILIQRGGLVQPGYHGIRIGNTGCLADMPTHLIFVKLQKFLYTFLCRKHDESYKSIPVYKSYESKVSLFMFNWSKLTCYPKESLTHPTTTTTCDRLILCYVLLLVPVQAASLKIKALEPTPMFTFVISTSITLSITYFPCSFHAVYYYRMYLYCS